LIVIVTRSRASPSPDRHETYWQVRRWVDAVRVLFLARAQLSVAPSSASPVSSRPSWFLPPGIIQARGMPRGPCAVHRIGPANIRPRCWKRWHHPGRGAYIEREPSFPTPEPRAAMSSPPQHDSFSPPPPEARWFDLDAERLPPSCDRQPGARPGPARAGWASLLDLNRYRWFVFPSPPSPGCRLHGPAAVQPVRSCPLTDLTRRCR